MIEISCDFVEHPRKVRSLPPELTTQSPQESLKPYGGLRRAIFLLKLVCCLGDLCMVH